MSDFGDFEDSDAFDTAAPDPEQVARKFHNIRRELETLPIWDELSENERVRLIAQISRLLDWLRREGAIR